MFGWIGAMGPFILIGSSCILLSVKPMFLACYLLGIGINSVLNLFLKGIIRQNRPKNEIHLFELGSKHGKRYKSDRYGMPSGHSQSVGFSLAYLVFMNMSQLVSWLFAFVSAITLTQRYIYRNHTLLQIIVGFMLGNVIGYIFYRLGKRMTKDTNIQYIYVEIKNDGRG
jgi:membrane-associated phospholipid phosphatase